MATVRTVTYRGGWVTVDLTYDTADGNFDPDLDGIHIACRSPVALKVRAYRVGKSKPWRTWTVNNGDVVTVTSMGGRVRKVGDLDRWTVGEA